MNRTLGLAPDHPAQWQLGNAAGQLPLTAPHPTPLA